MIGVLHSVNLLNHWKRSYYRGLKNLMKQKTGIHTCLYMYMLTYMYIHVRARTCVHTSVVQSQLKSYFSVFECLCPNYAKTTCSHAYYGHTYIYSLIIS